MSNEKPTQGERERPGGPGGGTPDKSGTGTDKGGSGQGGDKPGGSTPSQPSGGNR